MTTDKPMRSFRPHGYITQRIFDIEFFRFELQVWKTTKCICGKKKCKKAEQNKEAWS